VTVALHPLWFVHPLIILGVLWLWTSLALLLGTGGLVVWAVRRLRDWVTEPAGPR
jgi:hypothetical protein